MSDVVVLSAKAPIEVPLDGSCVAPDRFAALSEPQIARLEVWHDQNGPGALGEYFSIRGERSASVRVEGDCALVEGLGAGMAGGTLFIEGHAGRETGARMSGGRLEVAGDVSADAGLEMVAGTFVVRGNAGSNLGGAGPGATRGMRGGEIVVFGSAAAEAGARMRRGLICVVGIAEAYAGRSMIAGTIVILGPAAAGAGQWSKRGSLVALGQIALPPSYRYACTYRPPHIPLILRHLRHRYEVPITDQQVAGKYHRYSGDLAELAKGEILEWTEG